MKHMAGRKRHSAEDIVRKLRRADELAAEGKTGEDVAAELGVSAATLYNWRRAYGGMDADAAKELKELREHGVSPIASPPGFRARLLLSRFS
jgi:transposase-like protein